MRCGFSVNINKPEALQSAVFFADRFSALGVEVVFDDICSIDNYSCLPISELATVADILLVFGGDGTVLRIASACARQKTPILAINLGKLGFLADADPSEVDRITDMVVNGHFEVEHRSMLNVEYDGKTYLALNEVVVARGPLTKMINVAAYLDGMLIDKYFADGLIVSTPTGSTAYSLSAGGPILAPDVSALVLTPIASHSLHTRPIVFSDNKVIELKLSHAEAAAFLSVDGNDVCGISDECSVMVSLAKYQVCFIRSKADCFIDKLLDKLNYWSFTHKE